LGFRCLCKHAKEYDDALIGLVLTRPVRDKRFRTDIGANPSQPQPNRGQGTNHFTTPSSPRTNNYSLPIQTIDVPASTVGEKRTFHEPDGSRTEYICTEAGTWVTTCFYYTPIPQYTHAELFCRPRFPYDSAINKQKCSCQYDVLTESVRAHEKLVFVLAKYLDEQGA
jgi:hypothetical protein